MSLIGLLKDKEVMVGAIDVASFNAETPEQVAAVIHEAGKYVSAEQIFPCTNCGMAPLPRDLALKKLQALGAGARLAARGQ
jgi:5-methyltetrahydropteroyltriglutamate--homocysteine methyltransferase